MARLQGGVAAAQRVIVGVADLGRVALVVGAVVAGDLGGQPLQLRLRLAEACRPPGAARSLVFAGRHGANPVRHGVPYIELPIQMPEAIVVITGDTMDEILAIRTVNPDGLSAAMTCRPSGAAFSNTIATAPARRREQATAIPVCEG